jgi:hypothetical protein
MKLSQEILSVFKDKDFSKSITFGQFVKSLEAKSFYFLILIFALPPALPIPAPGFAIPFGMAIILLSWQLLRKKTIPWFPTWLLNLKLVKENQKNKGKSKQKGNILTSISWWLSLFERLVRPRLLKFSKNQALRNLHLGLVIICGLSMLIPLPLTNTAPAFGVFISSLGLLEDDGLVFLLGFLAMLAGLLLSGIIVGAFLALGSEGVSLVRGLI